ARAKTSCRQTGGEAAMIGEPFQRTANGRAIDDTCAEAGYCIGEVQGRKRVGVPAADPTQAGQNATSHNQQPRSKLIDQIAFERDQPRFQKDEDRECYLDEGLVLSELLRQRWYEQRPAILKIRNRDHADNAEQQDEPSVSNQ